MSSEEYLKTDHQLSSPVFKFEVYGEELICKKVKRSGGCGHFYVPASWSGKHIKIMDGKSLPMSGFDRLFTSQVNIEEKAITKRETVI